MIKAEEPSTERLLGFIDVVFDTWEWRAILDAVLGVAVMAVLLGVITLFATFEITGDVPFTNLHFGPPEWCSSCR